MISSGQKASFIMLDWETTPLLAAQKLRLTLQKPSLVAELGFMMALTKFFVPSVELLGNTPIPYASQDILLTGVYISVLSWICCKFLVLLGRIPHSQTPHPYASQEDILLRGASNVANTAVPLSDCQTADILMAGQHAHPYVSQDIMLTGAQICPGWS